MCVYACACVCSYVCVWVCVSVCEFMRVCVSVYLRLSQKPNGTTICDHPRGKAVVGKNIFPDFTGFRIIIYGSSFVQNLVAIVGKSAEI